MTWTINLDFLMMIWVDWILLLSACLLFLLGIAHTIFGYFAYTKGSSMNIFRHNGKWKPDGAKQKTLVGVFYMISFAWWENCLMIIFLLLVGNPIGLWLGVISLISSIFQSFLLIKYVRWNYVAQSVFMIHTLIIILWMIFHLVG